LLVTETTKDGPLKNPTGQKPRESAHFLEEQRAALVPQRTPFQPRIVPGAIRPAVTLKPLGSVARATLLRLRPATRGVLPIRVSARPYLRIGRGSRASDVLTRFLPETAANDRLTERLGRVHVVGRRVNGWPCFWDGDGRCPSVNGAWLDEERLAGEAGARSERDSSLRLGREYRVRVTCLDEEPIGLEPHGETAEAGIEVRGCTVIFSPCGQPPGRLVAWLGGSVGLQMTDHGVAWNQAGAARSDAALLHAGGGFWLANLALSGKAICMESGAVPVGCAVPLRDGREVAFGDSRYTICLED
jgi:hypothetical protein